MNERAKLTGHCELGGCGKEFLIPASATNKRFCCAEHKTEWHRREREKAMRMLRESKESKN